jgi:hypothetical protein
VLTGREQPPEDRPRIARIYRIQAIIFLVLGVLSLTLGAVETALHQRQPFAGIYLAFGAAWLVLAALNRARLRRYR